MEGISIINYNGKRIYKVDFTNYGTKEGTVQLISAVGDAFVKNPLNSVLALFDVTNAFFHFETFKNFKQLEEKCSSYEKKVALVGLKGLQKTGFKTISGSKKDSVKIFDSELEAKEWLTQE